MVVMRFGLQRPLRKMRQDFGRATPRSPADPDDAVGAGAVRSWARPGRAGETHSSRPGQ